jgi:hypothetical protein
MVAHGHLQALEAALHPGLRRRREFVAVEEGEAEGRVHGHLLRAPPSRRQHGWPRIWPFRSHSARSIAAMAWLA